jgi:hypothetical protein
MVTCKRKTIKNKGGELYGLPLFFFPCRDRRERGNRERGKKRATSGFFFLGVF